MYYHIKYHGAYGNGSNISRIAHVSDDGKIDET